MIFAFLLALLALNARVTALTASEEYTEMQSIAEEPEVETEFKENEFNLPKGNLRKGADSLFKGTAGSVRYFISFFRLLGVYDT